MDKSINKGKYILLAIIGVIIVADIISIAANFLIQSDSGLVEEARTKLFQGIFRLVLTALLMFCLYQGQRWARGVMVAVYIYSGAMSLLALLKGFNIIIIVLGLVYILVGVLILKEKNIQSFLEYQMENESQKKSGKMIKW